MAEILLKNIYKKYPQAEDYSVTDFNLEIEDKEFIVFVGPSGCGKSTTLRMIAGLEEISEGELWIDGKVVNDLPPKDRDIAMVFQNYALYPHMSVYDNMAYGLKIRKEDKVSIEKKVRDAAEILGLTDELDSKPAALSGGQRQRVALGRAIVRNAAVFLMDEPLSNLDAKLRIHMRTEIISLHKRLGTTTIYVTHDQTEAMTMADRIVIMKDGIIQQIGSPKNIYNKPDNVFVASFIGSPSMNFLKVTLDNNRLTNTHGLDMALNDYQVKLLNNRGHQQKEIILGIRPEDIHTEQIAIDANPNCVTNATVTLSELTGADAMLYVNVGDTEMVCRVDARDYQEAGDKIEIAFNMNKAHFFDAKTQEVIR